jgi:hypothetical protein
MMVAEQSQYRGEDGAGVSASPARRPQSRLALQGQQWIAACMFCLGEL